MNLKEIEANIEVPKETRADLCISTLAFGFTLGFGWFVVWHAIRQTRKLSIYTGLIWLCILSILCAAVIAWLYLLHVIQPTFSFFFSYAFVWALQIHCLLQIIVNRINLLEPSKRKKNLLKWSVAALMVMINISVFCVWIPSSLQVSQYWIRVNEIWDRIEKVIYLVTDGVLNWYFIKVVNRRLVTHGLDRYELVPNGSKSFYLIILDSQRLVRFNQQMIVISLSMDVFIIAMMSYPNGFVYALVNRSLVASYQLTKPTVRSKTWHLDLVKLNIEIAMGQMLKDIAGETSAVRPSKGEWENGLRIDVETQAVTHNLELEERKSKARPRPGLENRLVEAKKYLENGSIKEQGRDGSDASSTPTGSIEEKSGFRGVTFARD